MPKLHITTRHSGKMSGMQSLSTSCLLNPYCQARQKDPTTICSHCYAQQLLAYRKTARDCYATNTVILTTAPLADDDVPLINVSYFRLEAFGDLVNRQHAENYCTIARHNPHTAFTLWTKNPALIDPALLPPNLRVLYSSPLLNTPQTEMLTRYPWLSGLFTVYTPTYAKEHGIEINCGARSCRTCLRCYNPDNPTPIIINELLK